MVQKVMALQVKMGIGTKLILSFLKPSPTNDSVLQTNVSPLLVHCSAGVGRTGTFIALYKMWKDYNNPEVNITITYNI